jgi:hypothetical protein
MIHTPVPIEVVHPPVAVVVDEDVGGVAVLMPAILRPPTAPDPALIVLRGSEAAHHRHSTDGNALALQLRDH